jgi:hypothetical protein
LLLGSSLPLPLKFTISPFFLVQSGAPYNITTGIDSNDTGFAAERPELMAGLSASSCSGGALVYAAGTDASTWIRAPARHHRTELRARPGMVNLGLRLARTWSFGGSGESGPPQGRWGLRPEEAAARRRRAGLEAAPLREAVPLREPSAE